MREWIGIDLDGTLAEWSGWVAPDIIGKPIKLMVDRVKRWIKEDKYDVRIFTARVANIDNEDNTYILTAITNWCLEHIGVSLPITCKKDYKMITLWDDRCVQVRPNTGEIVDTDWRKYDTGVKK